MGEGMGVTPRTLRPSVLGPGAGRDGVWGHGLKGEGWDMVIGGLTAFCLSLVCPMSQKGWRRETWRSAQLSE